MRYGAKRVAIWEIFNTRPIETAGHGLTIASYHKLGIGAYCDPPTDRPIVLAHLPLDFLLRPSFDDVLSALRRYAAAF